MKKYVLIILSLFLVIDCYTQDYIPMLGDSNIWYILHEGEGYFTEIVQATGDTIIEKRKCMNFGSGFLCEDTITKRIYFRYPLNEQEILLYDFSLEKGDTIVLQRDRYPKDYCECIVDSVCPYQLNGFESRAIYLTGEPINWGKVEHPIWVEGIGSLGNMFYTAFGPDIHNLGELACYYKNGELLYQSALSKELDSCNINKPGGISNKYFSDLNIYPTPFNDYLKVDGLPDENVIIELYDLFGRKIYQALLDSDNSHKVVTTEINPGIYLIRIKSTDRGRAIKSKIIIKE